jgi:hypothetical protein
MNSTLPVLKPLYLDGVQPLAVVLDGPALKVMTTGRSPARYPLRRLSRVIVSGRVEWSTPALIACLCAGIVVSFLDENGDMAGLCLGTGSRSLKLYEKLAEFALRPDWPEHYANWYAAMERRGILGLVNRLSMRVSDLRPVTVRWYYMQRLGKLAPSRVVHRTLAYLEAAVSTCAAQAAFDSGIPSSLLTDDNAGIQLNRDLGRILAWEARVLAARLLVRDWSEGAPTRADMALTVERHAGRLIRQTHKCLSYLQHVATTLDYAETD